MSGSFKARIPRIAEGADIRSLPIGPQEGFVLSRIDGSASVADIADSTGLPSEMVEQTMSKLLELGAVTLDEPAFQQGQSRPAQPTPSGGVVRTRPPPPGTSRTLYDPAELEEDVDLDFDRRRQVLDTYYRLDELDHYELLGVEPDADKAEIRKAYFALSKIFHPDTLYGKRLGSYQPKMETVFGRLTEAYDVLGKKKNRAEYDEYLQLVKQTRQAQASLTQARREAEAIERGAVPVEQAAAEPAPAEAAPAEPPPERGAPSSAAEPRAGSQGPEQPAAESPPPERPASPPSEPQPSRPTSERTRAARRQLYARRLAAATGRPVPGAPRTSAPPDRASRPSAPGSGSADRGPQRRSSPGSSPAGRGERLRGLTSSLKQAASVTGGVQLADRKLAEARRAEQDGDLIEATNAVRLAMAAAPDREDLEAEHDRLAKRLAASMADTYAKQAEYEERQGKWGPAALSWSKVADGRPDDPEAARRAANAILKAGGDLKKAKVLAQRAVDHRPGDARSRRELGRVFLQAEMKLNAKRELEEAAKLDPGDEMVKNLLRELKEKE